MENTENLENVVEEEIVETPAENVEEISNKVAEPETALVGTEGGFFKKFFSKIKSILFYQIEITY